MSLVIRKIGTAVPDTVIDQTEVYRVELAGLAF